MATVVRVKDELALLFAAPPEIEARVVQQVLAMEAEAEVAKIRVNYLTWQADRADQQDLKRLRHQGR